ncbi:MAG: YaeQ family protein, partial [Acidobacteria bacterium]|nr:YaeQ family protein [Acidobacteriota bacterium]
MALGATLYTFEIDLADADRGVYETLELRAARHPSESDEYLIARILAYCLEYTDGIAFSKGGLSDPGEPPIAVRDLTGRLIAWIDVGTPDAARLHRAGKLASRVAVYMHKDPAQYLRTLAGARIHRSEALELLALDRSLVADLVGRLDRRMAFALSIAERELFVSIGEATLTGAVRR